MFRGCGMVMVVRGLKGCGYRDDDGGGGEGLILDFGAGDGGEGVQRL